MKQVPTAVILASLPESEVEAGIARGVGALKALEKAFGRVQALRKPVATEEVFEIVRRRLFETIKDLPARDAVPDFLLPPEKRAGLLFKGHATISYGATPEDTLRRLGGTSLTINGQRYRHDSFARMIAKFAYSYAFDEGAKQDIEGEPLIAPAIVSRPNEIGMWVGTLDKPLEAHPGMLHHIQYHRDEEKGLLCVEVQLFSESQTPSWPVARWPSPPRDSETNLPRSQPVTECVTEPVTERESNRSETARNPEETQRYSGLAA